MKKFYNTKKEIAVWLDSMLIENYSIVKSLDNNLVVNVSGHVDISSKGLEHFPIKFNIVDGDFICYQNRINSLEGSPNIVKGRFAFGHNSQLTSLMHCPQIIGSLFSCCWTGITSLKGCPKIINDDFRCFGNKLKTLKYGPLFVGNHYMCSDNLLTSLKGIPKIIPGMLSAQNNNIKTLLYIPDKIINLVSLGNNPYPDSESIKSYQDLYELHKIDCVNHEKNKLRKILLKNNPLINSSRKTFKV